MTNRAILTLARRYVCYLSEHPGPHVTQMDKPVTRKSGASLYPCSMYFKYSIFKEGPWFQDVPLHFDK